MHLEQNKEDVAVTQRESFSWALALTVTELGALYFIVLVNDSRMFPLNRTSIDLWGMPKELCLLSVKDKARLEWVISSLEATSKR